MAKRVFINQNNFKVSKPGFDAQTETSPQNLLMDSNRSSMGSYSTGQIIPQNAGVRIYENGFARVSIPFVAPSGGYIPLVVLQQGDGSTTATGVYERNDTLVYRELIATVPPTYFYYVEGEVQYLTYSVGKNALDVFLTNTTSYLRYHVFFIKAADDVYPPTDVTPAALAWSNVVTSASSGLTNFQTVSGLETNASATIKLSSSQPASASTYIRVLINRAAESLQFNLASGQSTLYFDIKNSDQVYFYVAKTNSDEFSTVLTITNESVTPVVTLDTISLQVNYVDNEPNAVNWSNVAGSNYAETNSQTLEGVNVAYFLRLDFNPNYTGTLSYNGNLVDVSNSASSNNYTITTSSTPVVWGFQPMATYNGVVTAKNVSRSNAVIDAFAVNVTVAANTLNANWGSIADNITFFSGTGTAQASTNLVYIGNITGSKSLTVNLSASEYTEFQIIKNGTPTSYTSGTSFSVSVTNGDSLSFYAKISRLGTASYVATCTILDAATTVDTFAINLEITKDTPN
jgi:hypothetical protein